MAGAADRDERDDNRERGHDAEREKPIKVAAARA
jgi:hypothetical protein